MATEAWAWQGGTTESDRLTAAKMDSDGSTVFAGFTGGSFGGPSAGFVDRVAVKLDVDGTVLWTWQNGTAAYENFWAADMDQDGSVVLAGYGGEEYATYEFSVVKLDADGSLLWQFQDGATDGANEAEGVAVAEDGSVVVVGFTLGDWNATNQGSADQAAFKLDGVDGSLLWKWQSGTSAGEYLKAVATGGEDGSIVMTTTSSTTADIITLDSEGTELWTWQDGSSESYSLNAVTVAEDGSIVAVGTADSDFAAVKLDAEGNEVWQWKDGSSESDVLEGVAIQSDGTILLAGYTTGSWDGSNAGSSEDFSPKDFAAVMLAANGTELWRYQDGGAGADWMWALAAGSDGKAILAGFTDGSWSGETNIGDDDFLAVLLDFGPPTTPSPTVGLTLTPATPPPPTAATLPATPPPSTTATLPATPSPSTAATSSATPRSPDIVAPSPAVTPAPSSDASSVANPVTTTSSEGSASDTTPVVVGVVSAVAGTALIVLAVLLKRWRAAKKYAHPPPLPPPDNDDDLEHHREQPQSVQPPTSVVVAGGVANGSRSGAPPPYQHNDPPPPYQAQAVGEPLQWSTEQAANAVEHGGASLVGEDAHACSAEQSLTATSSTANVSTAEMAEIAQFYHGQSGAGAASVGDGPQPEEVSGRGRASSAADRPGEVGGVGLGHAVLMAAQELAHHCHLPGVSEAAAVVCILVNLVTDSRQKNDGSDARLRQCRSIVMMLNRAAKVAGKSGDTIGEAMRVLIEDVNDAIYDLVELIKLFQSKNKLSKVLMSTLFKRRLEELDAVVDRAVTRLHLGVQVQVGQDMSAVKDDVNAVKDGINAVKEGMHLYQGSIAEATSESVAEARSMRRQRKLDQAEIPEDHVFVTEELLGKGGFGEVYLADYNNHNAAAKVLHIAYDLGTLDGNETRPGTSQRRAFLRELDAMIRLRSPHTVNVYGAVTSLPDRMVLVMELLVGGDLRMLLRNSKQPLPEEQCRRIIGDICTGMAFLHSKNTVHGDLKSANVLLDGAGRAKIGDFGTSRWSQHTNSTGLATYTTKSSQSTQMSLAWSAPEVLESGGSTYASDVYSFGIVVWEVISRELPWANKTRPRDILSAVLMGVRPSFHVDAPADIVHIARACWDGAPEARTTFTAIMKDMKAKGWNQ